MERRAIKISQLRLGLLSNSHALIHAREYFADQVQQSILTTYHKVEDIAWDGLDVQWTILDEPAAPASIHVEGDRIVAVGDFTGLETRNPDRRYSLFGNLGFLYRYVIRGLEEFHETFTFHASAMVDEATGELWLIPGSAGAGKTVFLLSGLGRGWTIFSTEMTHVRVTERGFEWFKGSLLDNIRVGNLLHDFPEATRRLGLHLPSVQEVWATKIAIDFAPAQTAADVLVNPPLRIIHPKVESGRETDVPITRRITMQGAAFAPSGGRHFPMLARPAGSQWYVDPAPKDMVAPIQREVRPAPSLPLSELQLEVARRVSALDMLLAKALGSGKLFCIANRMGMDISRTRE